MSANALGPVGDRDQAARATSPGRPWSAGWLPAVVVRYRAMSLIPLLALAGVAIAGLADLPLLATDASGYGSGCCPPR